MEDETGKIGVFSNRDNDYSEEEKKAIKEKLITVLKEHVWIRWHTIQVEFEGVR